MKYDQFAWTLALCLVIGVMPAVQSAAQQLTLELEDYAEMPITAQPGGQNTMAQLSRISFMRDEPGGERFFVNDLNGSLYILDKQTKAFKTYLNFNDRDGQSGLFGRFKYERNFATGLTKSDGMIRRIVGVR